MEDPAQTLEQALQRHQAGRLPEAEKLYREILRAQPQHAEALHLLGVLAHQQGRSDLAIEMIGQAITLGNASAFVHNNLGEALRALGKWNEAEACYRQALRLLPDYPEALNNLGLLLRSQGRLAEANALLRQALRLRPDYAEALNNLGVVLSDQGQHAEPEACLRQALQLRPDYAEAYSNLGNVLADQGQWQPAAACYRQALRLQPDSYQAYNNLGNTLGPLGQWEEAAACYRQALRLRPDVPETRVNLGMALRTLGQLEEAVASYREALRLRPDHAEALVNLAFAQRDQGKEREADACFEQAAGLPADQAPAHNHRGVALQELGRLDEAATSLQEAIRLRPSYPEAHYNLGITLEQQGNLKEAGASFDRALQARPDFAEAHLRRALLWLLQGRFEEGWAEYEWRWRLPLVARSWTQPLWDGAPLGGRTILLYAEQGLGDILQFVRYTSLVKRRGGTVFLECPPELVPLLESCAGVDRLLARGSPLPEFDVQAPLLGLPRIFGTSLTTIPAEGPYLSARTELVERWAKELASVGGLRVGIAWHGHPRGTRQRYVPLRQFAPLARIEGVRLVSLQKGPGTDQLPAFAAEFPITDLGTDLDTTSGAFVDTAAVLKNLDLVIAADVSVAHLAGALAVPVWVALPSVPDWRWLLGREDSPWYPTMRLFRQEQRGNWEPVFARLANELQCLIASS